ncbi:hypothetical protein JHD49_07875 [Sulfurimonas sp. SAG-AH-194-C21]|nr:hypothetical protein [Sulfurimonas sp. SAG-AH-194-C21]MDF1883850.1 hypothetical protein [Sulfurimonas sp. SAG-AH-194-C21]
MIRLFLLFFLLVTSVAANKVIYLSYDNVPQRVIKGEIFPITLKSLSTVRDFEDIEYKFSNKSGLKILNEIPDRVEKGKYFYDTFYLLSTARWAKLPDVNATLIASEDYNSTLIRGSKLNVVTLNPRKNFSKIIANNFEIIEYKTTIFDNNHNIIVLVAHAQNSDIQAMHFENVFKQGIESASESYLDSKITYFLVIDKKIENFSFSYFNLLQNKFSTIIIPIVVEDDSVTTQSDLKPKDQSKERLKMQIAGVIALIAFVFILWRRKYIYLILLIIPLIYIAYLAVPEQEICIKQGAQIRLLPVDNGTIFETASSQYTLLKEGSVDNFVKVKLKNEKIGWVKNEDICSY